MPSIDVLRELRTSPADGFRRGLDLGLRSGFGSDWLGIAAQKVVLDGGMQVETARMSTPYEGTDNVGVWRQDPQEMLDAIVDGHRAGWQMALHAIGDAALDLAIEALEKAQAAWPRPDARHRIEHGGVIRDDQLPRLARAGRRGGVPAVLPLRLRRSLRRASSARSARPGSTGVARCSTTASAWSAAPTDRCPAARCARSRPSSTGPAIGGQVLAADERIGVRAALEAFTANAAWALRREDRLGRVRRASPGRPHAAGARTPATSTPSTIADIPVLGTVVDGTPLAGLKRARRWPYRSAQAAAPGSVDCQRRRTQQPS